MKCLNEICIEILPILETLNKTSIIKIKIRVVSWNLQIIFKKVYSQLFSLKNVNTYLTSNLHIKFHLNLVT